jgi:hypothetical protein
MDGSGSEAWDTDSFGDEWSNGSISISFDVIEDSVEAGNASSASSALQSASRVGPASPHKHGSGEVRENLLPGLSYTAVTRTVATDLGRRALKVGEEQVLLNDIASVHYCDGEKYGGGGRMGVAIVLKNSSLAFGQVIVFHDGEAFIEQLKEYNVHTSKQKEEHMEKRPGLASDSAATLSGVFTKSVRGALKVVKPVVKTALKGVKVSAECLDNAL